MSEAARPIARPHRSNSATTRDRIAQMQADGPDRSGTSTPRPRRRLTPNGRTSASSIDSHRVLAPDRPRGDGGGSARTGASARRSADVGSRGRSARHPSPPPRRRPRTAHLWSEAKDVPRSAVRDARVAVHASRRGRFRHRPPDVPRGPGRRARPVRGCITAWPSSNATPATPPPPSPPPSPPRRPPGATWPRPRRRRSPRSRGRMRRSRETRTQITQISQMEKREYSRSLDFISSAKSAKSAFEFVLEISDLNGLWSSARPSSVPFASYSSTT